MIAFLCVWVTTGDLEILVGLLWTDVFTMPELRCESTSRKVMLVKCCLGFRGNLKRNVKLRVRSMKISSMNRNHVNDFSGPVPVVPGTGCLTCATLSKADVVLKRKVIYWLKIYNMF